MEHHLLMGPATDTLKNSDKDADAPVDLGDIVSARHEQMLSVCGTITNQLKDSRTLCDSAVAQAKPHSTDPKYGKHFKQMIDILEERAKFLRAIVPVDSDKNDKFVDDGADRQQDSPLDSAEDARGSQGSPGAVLRNLIATAKSETTNPCPTL